MKRIPISSLIAILAATPFVAPIQLKAFEPGFIITDEEILTPNTMSYQQIQEFLESHSGILDTYVNVDVDGHIKTAALIIHDAAARYNINPQYLLVLLQKEQGLITNSTPKDTQLSWATGYGVCDRCDVNHPLVVKYKGFAKQVDRAAWRTRYYIENIHEFRYKPGEQYTIDNEDVLIRNLATAALYNYTPHINGNKIFYKLWRNWFQDFNYPDGTLVQVSGEDGVWLIRNGQKHPFTSKSALTSRYDVGQIVQVTNGSLDKYTIGAPIGFAEYSLVRLNESAIYLIVDNELRQIADDFTFRQLGYTQDEVEDVSAADLAFFSQGEPITTASLEPLGALVQDPVTYGTYYVKNGIKYPLMAPELMSLNYPNLTVRKGTLEELEKYPKGSPVLLKDGFLVKTKDDPTVYVITNGQRKAIDNEFTFLALGFDWSNVKIITQTLLELHPLTEPISLSSEISDEEASELIEQEESENLVQ